MYVSKWLAAGALSALAASAAAANRPVSWPEGVWLNPGSSVAVRTGRCGANLCGWVVWASDEAQADAKDSGVAKLVGTELLEGYRPDGPAAWIGSVFVPDMGRHFFSKINLIGMNSLRVKGCLLSGLICKSQVWTRIEHAPNG